jgi:competence protein ComEA
MNPTISHVLKHLPHSLLAHARRSLKGASRLAAAAAASVILSAAAYAGVEVNQASTQAELESIRGIGPALSERILQERQQGAFKNWADLISRVRGVGESSAHKLSAQGLTVAGKAFEGEAPPSAHKRLAAPAASKTQPHTTAHTTAHTPPRTPAKSQAKPEAKPEAASKQGLAQR